MRSSKARAFTLVEVLLVIVIIAILAGLVLTGFSAVSAVDANTEAAKLMRSLQQLRSAWLAYYADEHEMLGVSGDNTTSPYGVGSYEEEMLSARMEASAADLIDRYGTIRIASKPGLNGAAIYIGFSGNWFKGRENFGGRTAEIVESMKRILKDGGYVLYGQIGDDGDIAPYGDQDSDQRILVRVK